MGTVCPESQEFQQTSSAKTSSSKKSAPRLHETSDEEKSQM